MRIFLCGGGDGIQTANAYKKFFLLHEIKNLNIYLQKKALINQS